MRRQSVTSTIDPPDHQRGSVAVEFAILMVLLVTILLGVIQFGIALSKAEVYIGAAREGARYAAVSCYPDTPCDNTKIAARVTNAAVGYSIGPGAPAANGVCGGSIPTGDPVTVSWTQAFTIDIPFVPGLNPLTINKTIQGVFRCE
jgi:Flp pilus assembly protein TadG